MKTTVAIIAALCCVLILLSSSVWAQSREERVRLSHDGVTLLNEGHALVDKARSKEDLQRAFQKFDQALRIFEKARNDLGIEKTIESLGILYDKTGRSDMAAKYFEKALKISKEIGDVQGEGHILRNLAATCNNLGQHNEATEHNEKALAISRKLGNAEDEATALTSLGIGYQSLGQYNKASDCAEKALAIIRRLNNPELEATTLRSLAWGYRESGEKEKAAQLYGKVLAAYRAAGNASEEGETLRQLGVVLQGWGQHDKAMECYRKSLDIAHGLGNLSAESTALTELGMAYRDIGQYDKAIEHLQRALNFTKQIGKRDREGEVLIVLGGVYAQKGDYAEALKMLQQGLSVRDISSRYMMWAKFLIGNNYLDLGDLDKAKPYVDFVSKETGYFSLPARYHFLKGEYDNARINFEKFVKFGEKEKDPTNLFISWTGLGLTYEAMQDYSRATEYFTQAVDQAEELRSGLSAAERATFFDVRVWGFPRTEPYEGLARVLMKLNKPVEALKHSEFTKARIFAESMSRRSGETSVKVPEDVLKKDLQLNERLASLIKKRQEGYEKGAREVVDAVEPQIKEAKGKLQTHIDMLRKQYPLFAATKYPQPMDVEQTAVKPEEWSLAYQVTDTGVCIWLLKGKNLVKSLFKTIPRKELNELVRSFRRPLDMEEITPKNLLAFKDALPAGRNLFTLLVGDFLESVPEGQPLIILPDGIVGLLPFEMLVINEGTGWNTSAKRPYPEGVVYFGDRNPISYYQSLTALKLARTLGQVKKTGPRTLVMADPVFESDDSRLREMEKKRRAELLASVSDKLMSIKNETGLIFNRLPLTGDLGTALKNLQPDSTDLYVGMDARKPLLFKEKLDKYRSVVFATHGYVGEGLPGIMEPVLVLTLVDQPQDKDGFLRMSEVMSLDLGADVVALTACQTGLGREVKGEGTMGMGRAFQYAGARSVLMSLWSVSETASVNLVEGFFKHLKEGRNKLEALRLAREEIRKAGYDHPFYWAPFLLVGEVN